MSADLPQPFSAGEKVFIQNFGVLIVMQCWKSSGVWQVRAYGRSTPSNPKGRYVFAAADAHTIPNYPYLDEAAPAGAAPERLWLSAADADNEHQVWFDPNEGGTPYIRADLAKTEGQP